MKGGYGKVWEGEEEEVSATGGMRLLGGMAGCGGGAISKMHADGGVGPRWWVRG